MSELFLETLNKFDSQLYPNFPNSFWIQYDILISIYCFGALFGIAGLIVRICKKQFWWLRIEMTSNGIRINQNLSISFLLFKTIFCVLAILSLIKQIHVYKNHGDQRNIEILRTAIWIPLVFGATLEAIGILSATPIKQLSRRLLNIQPVTVNKTSKAKSFTFLIYPLVATITFIYLLLSIVALVIPLVLANNWHNKLTDLYVKKLRPLLVNAAAGKNLSKKTYSEIIFFESKSLEYQNNSAYWIKVGYGFYFAFGVIIYVIFMIGSIKIYRTLVSQRQILLDSANTLRLLSIQQNEVQTDLKTSTDLTGSFSLSNNSISDTRAHEALILEDKAKELKNARILLIAQTVIFTIGIIGYNYASLIACLFPIRVATDPGYIAAAELTSFWIYAVVGIPAMFLVFLAGISSKSANFIGTPSTNSNNHHRRTSNKLNLLHLSLGRKNSTANSSFVGMLDEEEELDYELSQVGVVNTTTASALNNNSHLTVQTIDTRPESKNSFLSSTSDFFHKRSLSITKSNRVGMEGRRNVEVNPYTGSSKAGNEFVDVEINKGCAWKPSSAWSRTEDRNSAAVEEIRSAV